MRGKEFEPDFPTEIAKEGKVEVVVPKLSAFKHEPSEYAPSKAPVFYNPVMQFNRDLTVLAFQAFQQKMNADINICEPLAATGIRAVRFATEIRGVKKVVTGDINKGSFELAKCNVQRNRLSDRIDVKHKDANRLLSDYSSPRKRFHIVDIDPFGSPVPFLDSAVRALRNKGMLAATATDMAPLCGVHPKACIRKYGGKPLRTEYCQELAVRLLVGCVASVAAKQEIGVQIPFSHSSDHYVRAYVQIDYGAKKADNALRNVGFVLHCFNCLHREVARELFREGISICPECGGNMDYAGPLWIGSIVDRTFCELMLKENAHRTFPNTGKITKLLNQAKEEAEAPATYHVLDKLSGKLSLPAPSVATFIETLRVDGFKAVLTHFNTRGVKTNAPALEMHAITRKLAAQQP